MFKDAVLKESATALTTNGAPAHAEVDMDNPLIQFYSRAGSYRASGDIQAGVNKFNDILNSVDPTLWQDGVSALLVAFWTRDPRNGIGERDLARRMFKQFEIKYNSIIPQDAVKRLMEMIVQYGRWDDLLRIDFSTDKFKQALLATIDEGIRNKDGLCFKWLPRPGSRNKENRKNAKMVMDHLKMDQYQYQKFLSTNSDTVEQKICAREFDKIDYSKVPTGAHLRHVKSFFNNDSGRFTEYLSKLSTGEAKINANAVTPYNILNGYISKRNKDSKTMYDQMFNSMKDFTEGRSALPMIDTSGSMHCNSNNGLVIDVALSLGVYCAMKNPSEKYKNLWLAFSSKPKLGVLKSDSFIDNCMSIRNDNDWGMSTNIEAAYRKILDIAKANNLTQEDLPEFLIIFSDMQFDSWGSAYSVGLPNNTLAHEMAKRLFETAGYTAPTLVYWNLAANTKSGLPMTTTSTGAMICSGQSPTLLPAIFNSTGVIELVVNTLLPYEPVIEYIITGE